jgi:phosphatidylserine/phosphatidylglycerophosphate/cardiolipin synthase-like enzyme
MKKIIGRLVTEPNASGTPQPLSGFRVGVRVPGSLFDFKGRPLAFFLSLADGRFELSVIPSTFPVRQLEIVAYDKAGRELPFTASSAPSPGYVVTDDRRARIEDHAQEAERDYGQFVIREGDARGLKTTLGTGQPLRFSEGNRVRTLMDRDAFTCAAAMMRTARQEVLVSQLFFAVPKEFDKNPSTELPSLLFDFDQPKPLDLKIPFPRPLRPGDSRPERALLSTATSGVDVRILLHAFTVPLFVKILAGALLFPFFGLGAIGVVYDLLGDNRFTDTDELKKYFGAANAATLKVLAFKQPVLSSGVLHAKLMMTDRSRMLSIGSPFSQSYVDRQDHAIDAWIRGGATGFPKHDAGFTMTGPAQTDFLETMRLLWNDAADTSNQLPAQMRDPVPLEPPPPPTILDEPEDGTCAVQLVRTLSCDQFDTMPKGEKGILEAYLRGFASAKEFIYLETQYFTNDAIGEGLVNALLSEPQLKVIVLLNIEPDVPTYPFKQRRLITRIRRAIGQTPTGPQRFGVFTRWTHEAVAERLQTNPPPTKDPRPRLLPIYVHAKVGIIDNTWATIGSANLDGLSLDSSLPSDIFNGLFNRNEQRAIEVNGVFFDTKSPPNNVVDILRRKLWAEHLGFLKPDGTPDTEEPLLRADQKPPEGWLKRWSDRADAMLQHLIHTPAQSSNGKARVLPWPTDDSTHKTPRDHMDALGVTPDRIYKVVPMKSTAAFDFKSGTWDQEKKAKLDF